MSRKVVIVGGVAGGAGTAARLRRLDETAHIIMFERGKYISYANCGLPYYIGDTIKNREALIITSKEKMTRYFNIDVRTEQEVIVLSIKTKRKSKSEISFRTKNTGRATIRWFCQRAHHRSSHP